LEERLGGAGMNREMICGWLGLAEKRWPPDPYALLGLNPTDCDGPRIELRVQERMAKLRCYQLSHPEEATEGMNRVAQAFICLIEAASKKPVAAKNGPPKVKAPHVNGNGGPAKPAPPPKPAPADGDTAKIEQTRF